jgi:hypothetical protein
MPGQRWNGAIVALSSIFLVACGGSGGSDDGGSPSGSNDEGGVAASGASGVSQKGPFRAGGTAVAVRLASDGTLSDEQVSGSIDDRGQYELAGVDWTGPTRIQMQGTFFDEVSGNFSSDSRTLNAVAAAEEGAGLDANVNLYTHFAAARIRLLMGEGESFADARDTATAELQQALGISAAPEELNLLEAIDGVTEDSANLLLFSAAVQQGGIEQAGIDELAGDFADDGRFNGDGADEMQTILDEGTDSLLSEARTRLQNQYGAEPPSGGSGGGSGFGWQLSACAAASLTELRVFCSGEEFAGTKGSDEGEPVLFFPQRTGFYAFDMDGSELSSFAGWTLTKDSVDGTEVGSGLKDGNTTTFSLDAGDQYVFSLDLSGLDQAGDSFTLFAKRVSDGDAFDPVVLEEGVSHAARVGSAYSGDGGAARSWYRLDSGAGSHTIRTSGYIADPGSGGLKIEVYEGSEGQETVNDLNALARVGFVNGSGSSSNELTVDLTAGKPHFILITNLFSDFRRETTGGATTGSVEFDLRVTEN